MDEPSHTSERPFRSERAPGRRYDLFGGAAVPEVYVDGLSEIMLGAYVSRLTLHTTESLVQEGDSPVPVEQRRVKLRLVLPTPTLVEIAQLVLNNVTANAGMLSAALTQNIGLYQELGVTPHQLSAPAQKE